MFRFSFPPKHLIPLLLSLLLLLPLEPLLLLNVDLELLLSSSGVFLLCFHSGEVLDDRGEYDGSTLPLVPLRVVLEPEAAYLNPGIWAVAAISLGPGFLKFSREVFCKVDDLGALDLLLGLMLPEPQRLIPEPDAMESSLLATGFLRTSFLPVSRCSSAF